MTHYVNSTARSASEKRPVARIIHQQPCCKARIWRNLPWAGRRSSRLPDSRLRAASTPLRRVRSVAVSKGGRGVRSLLFLDSAAEAPDVRELAGRPGRRRRAGGRGLLQLTAVQDSLNWQFGY